MRVAAPRPERQWAINSDGALAMTDGWKLKILWRLIQTAEILTRLWPLT